MQFGNKEHYLHLFDSKSIKVPVLHSRHISPSHFKQFLSKVIEAQVLQSPVVALLVKPFKQVRHFTGDPEIL